MATIKQRLASLPGDARNYAKIFGVTNVGFVVDILDINSASAKDGPRKCNLYVLDPPRTSDVDPTPLQGPTLHYNWTEDLGFGVPALFCPVPAYAGNTTPEPPAWNADYVGNRICPAVPPGLWFPIHVGGRWLHLCASGGAIVVIVVMADIYIT